MPSEQLDLVEFLRILKNNPTDSLIAKYTPALKKCPMCNVDRPIFKKRSICTDRCLKKTVESLLAENNELLEYVVTKFALSHKLGNGVTIRYLNDDYRNNNLVFWDNQNKKIVFPFTEIDDYGSVPPIFPVGDGYFNPTDWLDEVDHNSFVFPSITLIREFKDFVKEHPTDKKMIVEINGVEYMVKYNPLGMKGKWDSCFLEVMPAVTSGIRQHKGPHDILLVHRGEPSWRKDIVEETNADIKNKNATLLELLAKHKAPGNVVNAEINRQKAGKKTRKNRKN